MQQTSDCVGKLNVADMMLIFVPIASVGRVDRANTFPSKGYAPASYTKSPDRAAANSKSL